MRAVRVLVLGALAGCLAQGAPAPAAARSPALRLGYVASIRASWTIAVAGCPSCSQPQRSYGAFGAGAGRAALRRRAGGLLPACDPDVDQPVADAGLPAVTVRRAYLRGDTAYLRLRGRRRFDVAPDAAMPGPDLGPPPGHWTGTLTWSLTATLTRCRTVLGHRRCAF
ncbi:MAG: hypothetical protein E6G30_10370 [Actinobacteria bacterium]|nr:MAG: hypothetical protein E6G30_10370 [Actinomycetota bacterium]